MNFFFNTCQEMLRAHLSLWLIAPHMNLTSIPDISVLPAAEDTCLT
jgi:hypothetical protein